VTAFFSILEKLQEKKFLEEKKKTNSCSPFPRKSVKKKEVFEALPVNVTRKNLRENKVVVILL